MVYYLLFESAAGYGLFEVDQAEEIATLSQKLQDSIQEFQRFSRIVKMRAFNPFTSAEEALENINDTSEGIVNDTLREFFELNLSKKGKENHRVGVAEGTLKSSIEALFPQVTCTRDSTTQELLRGIRFHLSTYLGRLKGEDEDVDKTVLFRAQRGLAHSYGRAKIKFNVNRSDNAIIQAISILDQLDKDINTLSMRLREWYSWHFPELVKIVNDNLLYSKIADLLNNRDKIDEETVRPQLIDILGDEQKAASILSAAKTSMGYTIADFDVIIVKRFAAKVASLTEYRHSMADYLHERIGEVAPNLAALIGDVVGARLINHAGSLTTLAKYPASTVQILGAEKAIYRALKTRGNTPKYGLIFNSSFIGKAKAKDRGRISRYLANKASIAARLDAFADTPTDKFGIALKQQVEDRLRFYEDGVAPAKNLDVMREIMEGLGAGDLAEGGKGGVKRSREESEEDNMEVDESPTKKAKKEKKEKKDKSKKKSKKKSSKKDKKKSKSK